jgi:hypothetical protein
MSAQEQIIAFLKNEKQKLKTKKLRKKIPGLSGTGEN